MRRHKRECLTEKKDVNKGSAKAHQHIGFLCVAYILRSKGSLHHHLIRAINRGVASHEEGERERDRDHHGIFAFIAPKRRQPDQGHDARLET